ncbi:MAG: hypothetical protein OEQ53_21890, partial [Saprospiraceae bacterium]|nr:hypothetical protein [Saprospiraceae bacterium]
PPSIAIMFSLPLYYTKIDLPNGVLLSRLDFTYQDSCSTCEFHIWINRVSLNPSTIGDDHEVIGHFNTSYSSSNPIRTDHISLTEVIDNENFYYLISVGNGALPLNPRVQFYNAKATYSY